MNLIMRGTLAKLKNECEMLKTEVFSMKTELKDMKNDGLNYQNDEGMSEKQSQHSANMEYLKRTFGLIEDNIRRLDNDVQDIREGNLMSEEKQSKVRLLIKHNYYSDKYLYYFIMVNSSLVFDVSVHLDLAY